MSRREDKVVSKRVLERLPFYLHFLKQKYNEGVTSISAPIIASDLGQNEVQVRKDLALVSLVGGKPKTGYDIHTLILDIESFLGYNNENKAVLVGAGHLGRALLSYEGFNDSGVEVVAAFDMDKSLQNREINGRKIYPMECIEEISKNYNAHIGIITVPSNAAQEVCDKLVESGVLAILNFAPIRLSVPENILVQNENTATSLAVLSRHLNEKKSDKRQ